MEDNCLRKSSFAFAWNTRTVLMFAGIAALWATPADGSLRPLLDAIREVESGGDPDAVGDGGRSLGPYQIQRPYWRDAGVPGRYQKVRDRAYAERVMLKYWQRYCPRALARRDYKTLARIHNGGPAGHRKSATLKYWSRVRSALAGN